MRFLLSLGAAAILTFAMAANADEKGDDLDLAYNLCIGSFYAGDPPKFTLRACDAISEMHRDKQRAFIERVAKGPEGEK